MKTGTLIAKVCFGLLLSQAFGTVAAQPKKTVRKPSVVSIGIEDRSLKMPEITDFAFVVDIDRAANVVVRLQKSEDAEYLDAGGAAQNLNEFFKALSALQTAPAKTKPRLAPIVIVRADRELAYGRLLQVLAALRVAPGQKIKLRIAPSQYVVVPAPLARENVILKPNPNMLLVRWEDDAKIRLNREEAGTIADTAPLAARLREIFAMRERLGVVRPGTVEVETSVHVAAPATAKFGDVMVLMQTIIDAGASPVGLYFDEDEEELTVEPPPPVKRTK